MNWDICLVKLGSNCIVLTLKIASQVKTVVLAKLDLTQCHFPLAISMSS